MLINHNAAPASKSGFICNFDMTQNGTNYLLQNSNTFKIYLYVISLSPTAGIQLNMSGCTAGAACAADSNFDVPIPGAQTYNDKDILVEVLTIKKSTVNTANGANVQVNAGAVNNYY